MIPRRPAPRRPDTRRPGSRFPGPCRPGPRAAAATAFMATIALLASGCTTPAPQPAARQPAARQPALPAWTSASFTMHSWGQPLTAWTVNADGSGTWSESRPRADGSFFDRTTTTRALPADPAAAAALAASLARLPAVAPDGERCKQRITDQPYGALTLTYPATGKTWRYDAGCLDAAYVRFLDQLRAADALVAARGAAVR